MMTLPKDFSEDRHKWGMRHRLPAVCLLEIYITEVTSLLNQYDSIF